MNRQFRDAVRNAGDGNQGNDQASTSKGRKKVPSEKMFGDVSRVDCEEAVVQLQLRHGCVTRMCEDGQELAGYVISLTRAIADSPYQYGPVPPLTSDPYSIIM